MTGARGLLSRCGCTGALDLGCALLDLDLRRFDEPEWEAEADAEAEYPES